MRLINVETLMLEEFIDCTQVEYAILSHRWEEEEVLYKDIVHFGGCVKSLSSLKGFYKVRKSCETTSALGLSYLWIDTCCIDKSSSAELQEAINSMFRWYAKSVVCFAFLSDVRWHESNITLTNSQWFKRGWTLQELLAPEMVVFYDAGWNNIGGREQLTAQIQKTTGIPGEVLRNAFDPMKSKRCIAEIMSWACGRQTTRNEDRAYSLLGLFNVNMPMLYGEGGRAFYRLQNEILNRTEDQSIFAWEGCPTLSPGLLASSPDNFGSSSASALFHRSYDLVRRKAHRVTNEGIELEVGLTPIQPRTYMASLNLIYTVNVDDDDDDDSDEFRESHSEVFGIYLRRLDNDNRYARIPGSLLDVSDDLVHRTKNGWGNSILRTITVVQRVDINERWLYWNTDECGFYLASLPGSPDYWGDWIKAEAVAIAKGSWFPPLRLLTGPKAAFGLTACIVIDHNHWDPTSPLPFRAIHLGYDFDFRPVLVFSLAEVEDYVVNDPIRKFSEVELEGYERVFHTPGNTTFSIEDCAYWKYYGLGPNVVAFGNSSKESTFVALTTMIKLSSGRHVHLALSPLEGTKQWALYIDLDHKDTFRFRESVQVANASPVRTC